jgi:PHD/YefM family antitoxin component YafN of YafNO toxin-antitoxin module
MFAQRERRGGDGALSFALPEPPSMTTVTAAHAAKSFAKTLERVSVGRERIIVERDGKEVAAIVPVEDLKLLLRLVEEVEDRALAEMAIERESEAARKGEKPIAWEKVRRELAK